VDVGISDKRLCVTEGEFANVLKVMTREGNTLSPVIRSAWDSGDLRTLTKNSPARATDAHVSIIGHITNCELRRSLTETESANGFGNRFMWLAVRRSKLLPDGGNIERENFDDLVARLNRAIDFGRDADEVTRSNAARELWAQVYPKLSEGKPGLLGAVTARSEAQVLRLSVIYALLDCSASVEVEHLRAALALWQYCENSARWIFGTGTGDKNADKVLAALKVAGDKGLTKLQITTDVFHRNVTRFQIDESLRLLHSMRHARRIREKTAGRPVERWFFMCEGYEENEQNEQSGQIEAETEDSSYSSSTSLESLSAQL